MRVVGREENEGDNRSITTETLGRGELATQIGEKRTRKEIDDNDGSEEVS